MAETLTSKAALKGLERNQSIGIRRILGAEEASLESETFQYLIKEFPKSCWLNISCDDDAVPNLNPI